MVDHGGNVKHLAKVAGYSVADCLDFSANINPMGLSAKLRSCLLSSLDQVLAYPDVTYAESHQLLADYHACRPHQVLLANGAVELFYDLARFFQAKQVLTLSPTFMEYEKAFTQEGAQVLDYPLQPPYYTWCLKDLLPHLEQLVAGDVVVICNPNNPTGSLVDNQVLRQLAGLLAERSLYLIVDEAFLDFLPDEEHYSMVAYLKDYPNLVIVRSLTKFYALPGLRLGYALSAHPTCLSSVAERRPPWSVNCFAEAALPVVLGDRSYQEKTRQWLATEQNFFYQELLKCPNIFPLKPTANYIFLTYVGQLDLRKALWARGILIRSCANYHQLGQEHYRIAIRKREDNQRLLHALNEILNEEGQL